MIAATGFYFTQPWWLLASALALPMLYFARRNLATLGPVRRYLAPALRVLVTVLLAVILARPVLTEKSEQLTVITVLDRSDSIPLDLREKSLTYLETALQAMPPEHRLAVIDVAEAAAISQLPSSDTDIRARNTTLLGSQSRLADGLQIALAIAPPDSAVRLLLVSDGNQTSGNLKETARTAAANGIPIDVLPLRYDYQNEVIFRRLAAPTQARSGQTADLRFILNSTAPARGKIMLNLNDQPVDLAPDSDNRGVNVELTPGTNVKTIAMPLGLTGVHEFQAFFLPEDQTQDRISQNNRASAMTFVTGPGHVLVVGDDPAAADLAALLRSGEIDTRHVAAADLPHTLAHLLSTDAVILVNTDNTLFTYQQQEMLVRYVNEMGGGLAMVGGAESFGAGGWIGSPLAQVLPVDLDPPQKKQMPKGALALVMHACEMPQGNYWGKRVATVAVKSLSRLDLVGVLDYSWQGGASNWVYPLSPAGDKTQVVSAIKRM